MTRPGPLTLALLITLFAVVVVFVIEVAARGGEATVCSVADDPGTCEVVER